MSWFHVAVLLVAVLAGATALRCWRLRAAIERRGPPPIRPAERRRRPARRPPLHPPRRAGARLLELWPLITLATAGVMVGTLAGERLLLGLSRERFGQVMAGAIAVLGLWLLFGSA